MKVGMPRGAGWLAGARTAGFTIVETMVVLTVTGALFVAIAATLSGRQSEAEFTHSIQSVQSQLQQAVDQVSAGFFPTSDLTCSPAGSSLSFFTGGSQGTNNQCVFLGSVLQFGSGVSGSNPEQYRIYTIAGNRNQAASPSFPFQSVTPTVVGLSTTGDYADYSTPKTLEYGLTTLWLKANGTSGNKIGAVGILMEPGGFASSGGYNSGAQPVDLVPIPGTDTTQGVTAAVTAINQNLPTAPINPANGVVICFVSAGTNQSGLITIGSSGRQLIVKLDIKSNKTCN